MPVSRTLAALGLTAALTGGATAAPTYASGGADIASAPQLVFGGITSGGGLESEFWRVQLVAGDALTFRWDQQNGETPGVSLYAPTVDDYRIATTKPLVSHEVGMGKSEFQLVSPFSGNGTLAVSSSFAKSPFSFVATVEHKTAVLVARPPSLVSKPSTRFAVSARVVAEAGAVTGHCLFERIIGIRAVQLASVPIVGGTCKTMARTNSRSPVRFRVSYLPDDGWQASDAMSTFVRTRKATRSHARSAGVATKKKRVCHKVMSHGKITDSCRWIDPLAGTDCKHPFKLYWWFAGPAAKGAKKYATLKVEHIYGAAPNSGYTPRITWARTRGVVCKVVAKQDDQPEWSSTAQQGTHDLAPIPAKLNNYSRIPNQLRSVIVWVRKAHKK